MLKEPQVECQVINLAKRSYCNPGVCLSVCLQPYITL